MAEKYHRRFSIFVIVDLMATAFGVIVVLLLVSILKRESQVVEGAPKAERIYSAHQKFKIQSLNIVHEQEMLARSAASRHFLEVYDDRIEFIGSGMAQSVVLAGESLRAPDSRFRSFLEDLANNEFDLTINVYGHGHYYQVMDLILAYRPLYFVHSPVAIRTTPLAAALRGDKQLGLPPSAAMLPLPGPTTDADAGPLPPAPGPVLGEQGAPAVPLLSFQDYLSNLSSAAPAPTRRSNRRPPASAVSPSRLQRSLQLSKEARVSRQRRETPRLFIYIEPIVRIFGPEKPRDEEPASSPTPVSEELVIPRRLIEDRIGEDYQPVAVRLRNRLDGLLLLPVLLLLISAEYVMARRQSRTTYVRGQHDRAS